MGMGHPSNVVARARTLHEAGWRCGEIPAILHRELGVCPHEVTVRRWIDPDYAEAQKLSKERSGRQMRKWGWRSRLRRLRELREIGLSFSAIAALMSHDFGLELSERQAEAIAKGTCIEATVKRLLAPEGCTAAEHHRSVRV